MNEITAAAEAARHVAPDSTIFLDDSPLAVALARRLRARPPRGVTVVTNSLEVATAITPARLLVLVCPGRVDQQRKIMTGPFTVAFLRALSFDAAFVSGIDPVARTARTRARRAIELAGV